MAVGNQYEVDVTSASFITLVRVSTVIFVFHSKLKIKNAIRISIFKWKWT